MQKFLTCPILHLTLSLKNLEMEVQHSAYQERIKLRHVSGESTKEAVSCSIPTSISSLRANHKSFFHDSSPTKEELEKNMFFLLKESFHKGVRAN